ncbi:MAG: hypothetical protein HY962_07895 [Ignavibacteriae bacterium]|nr:hypothetical protein [Ignavibacteriota bacterium]
MRRDCIPCAVLVLCLLCLIGSMGCDNEDEDDFWMRLSAERSSPLVFHDAGDSRLVCATVSGAYVSTDGGTHWSARIGGMPKDIYIDKLAGASGGAVFSATLSSTWVYVLDTAAWSWKRLGEENASAFHSLPGGELIIARPLNGLFGSTDGGASWTPIAPQVITPTKKVTVIRSDTAGRLVIGTTSGLYISDPSRQSWICPPALEAKSILTVTCTHGKIYVLSDELHRSDDNGASWVNRGPVVSSHGNDMVAVNNAVCLRHTTGPFVEFSRDGGATWIDVTPPGVWVHYYDGKGFPEVPLFIGIDAAGYAYSGLYDLPLLRSKLPLQRM